MKMLDIDLEMEQPLSDEPRTIEELFANYKEEPFSSEIVEFSPKGRELW